jgi:hypothetical protein
VLAFDRSIGDAPTKMCQTRHKTTVKNSPKLIQFFRRRWEQLLIANERNRVRWVVLGLSQDGLAAICLKSQRAVKY